MFELEFSKRAQKELKKIQKDDRLLQKLFEIFRDLEKDPHSANFKMEKLKYNFQDHFSKRLDKKNRLIYQVLDDRIVVSVISILGHYEE